MKVILLSLLMSLSLFAQDLTLKEGFVAAHTEMIIDTTIDPLNSSLNANVTMEKDDILSLKGKFWIPMNQFFSDNKDRDEKMDEANQVQTFPLANYTLTQLILNEDKSYTIKGNLEFLGVVKPLEAQAHIIDKDGLITLSASTKIFADDFGLEMPCLLFMCVDKNIEIYVKAVFVK